MVLCVCFAGCKNNGETAAIAPQNLVSSNQAIPIEINSPGLDSTTSKKVYVCQSSGATKYHYNKSCHALKRCSHTVTAMKRKEAENIGLQICGYEN